MKTLAFLIIFLGTLFISVQVNAQRIGNLNGINYQAVAVDEDGKEIVGIDIDGKPLYEKEIAVRFTIQKGHNGEIQFQETHTTITDQYGLFSLVIGHGQQTGSGAYSDLLSIPWIDADQWLRVEISITNTGNFRLVSLQQLMAVPYSFYTDDIADDAITTEKIFNEAILNEDISTGAVDTRTLLNETILAEDIATGAVETSEILDFTIINQDIATGAVDTRTILDETIVNEDVATGAVDTRTLLNETILAEDIATGAVETSEILDFTIINQDIATGAVDTRTILDETIVNEDVATGAVDTRTLLNETILAEDIATGAVETSEILDFTIINQDIATGAVDTRTILNETIVNEDIATGAVDTRTLLNGTIINEDIGTGAINTRTILNGTIINEDIANSTIDLTAKVAGVLPVQSGGTGVSSSTAGGIMLGGGAGPLQTLGQATNGQIPVGVTGSNPVLTTLTAGTGISITNSAGQIIIRSTILPGGGISTIDTSHDFGTISSMGGSVISAPITLPGVVLGDFIIGSISADLRGAIFSTYVVAPDTIRMAIYNASPDDINWGGPVNLRFIVIK